MTHDDHWRSRRFVVVRREHAAAKGADAKRREIVAGDVLGTKRPRACFTILPADAQTRTTGLKRRDLFELRQLRLQPLEQRIGKHSPPILRTILHAAGGAVADSIETIRMADRQRSQHDDMYQGEDGRRPTDAERKCQHGCRREDPRHPELSKCVANVAQKVSHRCLDEGQRLKRWQRSHPFDRRLFPNGTSRGARDNGQSG